MNKIICIAIFCLSILMSCNTKSNDSIITENDAKIEASIKRINSNQKIIDSLIKVTSANSITIDNNRDSLKEVVRRLLIAHYQAGWIDARNTLIDLHNDDIFNNKHIEKERFKAFRKIEGEVNSK